ncbi:MAG: hypothetical protein Roseis2KO_41780 [Roseivirga sp.]
MPKENFTVFTILISCPSDVKEEKEVIEKEVKRFNRIGDRLGFMVNTKHWEDDSSPGYGGTQGSINHTLVDQSDIIIAVFGNLIGNSTGKAPSGTVEEIERAVLLKKEVAVYFSKKPLPSDIDLEEVRELRDYKKKIEGKHHYGEYEDNHDFGKKITDYLLNTILEKIDSTSHKPGSSPQTDLLTTVKEKSDLEGRFKSGVFSSDFFKFTADLPKDWHYASKETIDHLNEVQIEMLSGGNKEEKSMLEFLFKKTSYLFVTSRFPFGVDTVNSNLICTAEVVSHLPAIQNGLHYLQNSIDWLFDEVDEIQVTDEIYEVVLGNQTFYALELYGFHEGIYQIQLASVIDGYALNFSLNFQSQQEFDTLMSSLDTLRFY